MDERHHLKVYIPTTSINAQSLNISPIIQSQESSILNVQKSRVKIQNKRFKKIIAFDLDETLGSFHDLHILWCGLKQIRKNSFTLEQDEFNAILDLYPEFLRDRILHILEYIYEKKQQCICDKIYIYTNNQCQPPWVSLISNYFAFKLGIDLFFDKNVCAFKIKNVPIEISRTSHKKTYTDFIHCTVIPKTSEICFIDNTHYPEMQNEKIYYIQPRAYVHSLGYIEIIERFLNSEFGKSFQHSLQTTPVFKEYLLDWFDFHGSHSKPQEKITDVHYFVAQKMLYHIKEFLYFANKKPRTKKRRTRLSKVTRKNYKM